jgi:hypothetical protein
MTIGQHIKIMMRLEKTMGMINIRAEEAGLIKKLANNHVLTTSADGKKQAGPDTVPSTPYLGLASLLRTFRGRKYINSLCCSDA